MLSAEELRLTSTASRNSPRLAVMRTETPEAGGGGNNPALERLKAEYSGSKGSRPDRLDPILPAGRHRRKPDEFHVI